jgi:hypothetical protein
LATNDPSHPLLKFTLIAEVKPIPEIYRRFQNPNYVNGQLVETFEVWPSARPFIIMEKGERLTIPLRIWRGQINPQVASLPTQDIQAKKNRAPDAIPKAEQGGDSPFPAGSVNYRIRSRGDGRGFWVDIELVGVDKPGTFTWSANVADPASGESLSIGLSALVLEENLIVNPKVLSAPDLSLASLKAPVIAAQVNVRKMIGSIHIRAVSSTLGFVKPGVQVLVDGSNYLVKAYLTANPGVDPGKYEGTIKIDTDDPARRQIEVPFRVTFIP